MQNDEQDDPERPILNNGNHKTTTTTYGIGIINVRRKGGGGDTHHHCCCCGRGALMCMVIFLVFVVGSSFGWVVRAFFTVTDNRLEAFRRRRVITFTIESEYDATYNYPSVSVGSYNSLCCIVVFHLTLCFVNYILSAGLAPVMD